MTQRVGAHPPFHNPVPLSGCFNNSPVLQHMYEERHCVSQVSRPSTQYCIRPNRDLERIKATFIIEWYTDLSKCIDESLSQSNMNVTCEQWMRKNNTKNKQWKPHVKSIEIKYCHITNDHECRPCPHVHYNGGIWKRRYHPENTSNVFRPHPVGGIWKQSFHSENAPNVFRPHSIGEILKSDNHQSFWIRAGKSHDYCDVIVFQTFSFTRLKKIWVYSNQFWVHLH